MSVRLGGVESRSTGLFFFGRALTRSSRSFFRLLRPSNCDWSPSTASSAVFLMSSIAASNFCTFFLCSSSKNFTVASVFLWCSSQSFSYQSLDASVPSPVAGARDAGSVVPPRASPGARARGESGVGPGSPRGAIL